MTNLPTDFGVVLPGVPLQVVNEAKSFLVELSCQRHDNLIVSPVSPRAQDEQETTVNSFSVAEKNPGQVWGRDISLTPEQVQAFRALPMKVWGYPKDPHIGDIVYGVITRLQFTWAFILETRTRFPLAKSSLMLRVFMGQQVELARVELEALVDEVRENRLLSEIS